MSDDWKVGDLAIACGADDDCPNCRDQERDPEAHGDGAILEVSAVEEHPYSRAWPVGLWFADGSGPWCECAWRKIRPDAHEAGEECPALLNLSKRRVKSGEPA